MSWIDISLALTPATAHWPGHPRYTVDELYSLGRGDEMNVTAVSMCSHFGTHLDAPRHYIEAGAAVDELPLDLLVGPCSIVHYDGDQHIPPAFVDSLDLRGTRRLLIRTGNSETIARPKFREDYVALTPAAAERLVAHGIELLGVDGYSIGPFDPELGIPVHRIFLSGGPHQIALEGLDLSGVEPGSYELVALPIPLAGLEAAPARVLVRAATNCRPSWEVPNMQEAVQTPDAPAPVGPYSPALLWEELVFVSGQGPIDPRTGDVESADFAGQSRQAFANLDTLLSTSGTGRDRVLKVQVYLTDLANFATLNELYAEFFDGCTYPARTTIQAAALPGGIQVELDAIAYRSRA